MSAYHWIGLSDSASEGTWLWLNGNRANPDDGSLWHPGHPRTDSSGTHRDCVIAEFRESASGSFVWDLLCSDNRLALCEKPV